MTATDQAPAAKGRRGKKSRTREFIDRPLLALAKLTAVLAGATVAGVVTRQLFMPAPLKAGIALLVATALLAAWHHWKDKHRAKLKPGTGVTWQPGEPPPARVPAKTTEAIGRIFQTTFPGRRYRGAWLEIAPHDGNPEFHKGICCNAYVEPGGDGMLRVVIGGHLAGHPAEAAFAVAHEVRHPAGWTVHLSVLAVNARVATFMAAGWANPWPRLLMVLAIIQVAYVASCWVVEIGCDVGAVRAEGRDVLRLAFDYQRRVMREPRQGVPPWEGLAILLLYLLSIPVLHPPLALRAAIASRLAPQNDRLPSLQGLDRCRVVTRHGRGKRDRIPPAHGRAPGKRERRVQVS